MKHLDQPRRALFFVSIKSTRPIPIFQPVFLFFEADRKIEVVSKFGLWLKVEEGLFFKPEEYGRISRA
jgi:hypothetical protein